MSTQSVFVRKATVALLLTLSLALSLSLPATAATVPTNSNAKLAIIRINNFGRINANYFRGAQPDGRDYKDLASIGVKTVIDLTAGGRSDEQGIVERAGMKFFRIPMTTSDRPDGNAVTQFLRLVNDPANLPVYVHCQGGRHRTGVMTAVYRMTQDGWTAEQSYAEMKRFKFEGFPGHPTLKRFVYDYFVQLDRTRLADNKRATSPAAAGVAAVVPPLH